MVILPHRLQKRYLYARLRLNQVSGCIRFQYLPESTSKAGRPGVRTPVSRGGLGARRLYLGRRPAVGRFHLERRDVRGRGRPLGR